MGRVGLAPELDVREGYAARAVHGESDYSGVESPSNGSFLTLPSHAASVLRRRYADLVLAMDVKTGPVERLLHVGSGEGGLLALVNSQLEVEAVGMEPMLAWAEVANDQGHVTLDIVPELSDGGERYDVVCEHHLINRLPEPRRHLRFLRRLLTDDGVLVLEVPNLLHAPRPLAGGYLSPLRPHLFTARSLRTMCERAGFRVMHLEEGTELRAICRPLRATESRSRELPVGAGSEAVFHAVRCNDMRIRLKRVMADKGPTPEVLRVAIRAYDLCTWAPGRADLAIEIAASLECVGRWDEAASWLRRSLLDRKDPDVACMAIRCEAVAKATRSSQQGASELLGPDLGERVANVARARMQVN